MAFDNYLRAKQSAMQQGMNALAMEQAGQEMRRDRQMRNVLAESYTPSIPATERMGPVQPGGILAPTTGRMNMPKALGEMYEQGLGPEAIAFEQAETTRKAKLPSAVQEFQFFKENVAPKGPQAVAEYLSLKRQGFAIKDVGGVPTLVSMVPGQGDKPLSTLEAETQAEAEKKRSQVLGGKAAELSLKAVDQAEKIRGNVRNLKEVTRLVREEGASTGPLISRLPSFRAASIRLDNMQKQLGLDVIGAVTFGALSKGELDLALSKGLPTHLKGPDLIQWADDKITAQEKLANYFEEQAIFLSKSGNTPAGWVEQQKAKVSEGHTTPQTQADYDAIPSGTIYIDPDDGKQYRKP